MLAGVLAASLDLAVVLAQAASRVGRRANVEESRQRFPPLVEAVDLALENVDPPFGRHGHQVPLGAVAQWESAGFASPMSRVRPPPAPPFSVLFYSLGLSFDHQSVVCLVAGGLLTITVKRDGVPDRPKGKIKVGG